MNNLGNSDYRNIGKLFSERLVDSSDPESRTPQRLASLVADLASDDTVILVPLKSLVSDYRFLNFLKSINSVETKLGLISLFDSFREIYSANTIDKLKAFVEGCSGHRVELPTRSSPALKYLLVAAVFVISIATVANLRTIQVKETPNKGLCLMTDPTSDMPTPPPFPCSISNDLKLITNLNTQDVYKESTGWSPVGDRCFMREAVRVCFGSSGIESPEPLNQDKGKNAYVEEPSPNGPQVKQADQLFCMSSLTGEDIFPVVEKESTDISFGFKVEDYDVRFTWIASNADMKNLVDQYGGHWHYTDHRNGFGYTVEDLQNGTRLVCDRRSYFDSVKPVFSSQL